MTKAVASKSWTLYDWADGSKRSYEESSLGSSALYTAAAALSAGDDAAFSTSLVYFDDGATTSEEASWEWQSHGLFDATRGYAHIFGKAASQDSTWSHRYFDVAANVWHDGGTNMWDNIGHIYGNIGLDSSTGDCYIARGGLDGNSVDNYKRLRRWDFATKSWGSNLVPVSQDIYASGLAQMGNGLAYHPDLFGSGDGGLVLDTDFRFCYWRKSTDAIFDTSHASQSQYGAQYGIGIYWADQNCIIVGGAGGKPLAKITPNGTSTPNSTTFATPPISVEGNTSAASNFGSLHVHPGDPTKLILVEARGSRRWYTCNSSGTFTRQDTTYGAHPFNFSGPYVVIPIAGQGAFWCLGFNGTTSTTYSRLWKPSV